MVTEVPMAHNQRRLTNGAVLVDSQTRDNGSNHREQLRVRSGAELEEQLVNKQLTPVNIVCC